MIERVTLASLITDDYSNSDNSEIFAMESTIDIFDIYCDIIALESNIATYESAILICKSNTATMESSQIPVFEEAIKDTAKNVWNKAKELWKKFVAWVKSLWIKFTGLFKKNASLVDQNPKPIEAAINAEPSSDSAVGAIKTYKFHEAPEKLVTDVLNTVKFLVDETKKFIGYANTNMSTSTYGGHEYVNDDNSLDLSALLNIETFGSHLFIKDANGVSPNSSFKDDFNKYIGFSQEPEEIKLSDAHITLATFDFFTKGGFEQSGKTLNSWLDNINKELERINNKHGEASSTLRVVKAIQTVIQHMIQQLFKISGHINSIIPNVIKLGEEVLK